MGSVIQNVNLKSQGTKFMCKLTLTHKKVNIKKSKAQCMPTFPKIKKIIKVKVKSGDFSFMVELTVNPTKIKRAPTVSGPKTTTAILTTSTTTSTATLTTSTTTTTTTTT